MASALTPAALPLTSLIAARGLTTKIMTTIIGASNPSGTERSRLG